MSDSNITVYEGEDSKLTAFRKALDWSYDKAINGVGTFGTAQDLASDYLQSEGTLEQQVDSLIRWQNTKSATSGFITGFGGFATLAVTLPANLIHVLYVQIRMVAAIAHMGGYDIHDDKVRTFVYACLLGDQVKEILKDVGVQIGKKVAANLIKNIPGKLLIEINKKVGFQLFTKAGSKGVINFTKAIPFLGGLIGASIDAYSTNLVGEAAKKVFIKN